MQLNPLANYYNIYFLKKETFEDNFKNDVNCLNMEFLDGEEASDLNRTLTRESSRRSFMSSDLNQSTPFL